LKRILFFVFIFTCATSIAQIGGTSTYSFLKLAPSSRITGLGETNITIVDYDPTTQLSNPASLNSKMSRQAHFSTVVYPGGVNYGNLGYVQDFAKKGTYGIGLQYIAYGNIQATDEAGNVTGKVNASEFNLYGGGAYRFGKIFSVGANLKLVYSEFQSFRSFGMAADLAATVNDTAHGIIATIAAKNIGGQLLSYTKGNHEPLPFDLQAGISVGFKNFPIRFHLTLHDLHRWDIRYDNPADTKSDNLFQDSSSSKPKKYIGDKIFRHVIFGAEINIKKVVFIDVAYNHQRRMEMVQTTRRSIAGFTIGLGVHVKQFSVGIALSPMPLKQTLAHFTFVVNTGGFIKKHPKT
jgi:hypothetical protein